MAEENVDQPKEKRTRAGSEGGTGAGSEGETRAAATQRIMLKPLPVILDELDDSIRSASEAARDAREAAEEARKAGEKAASEAARVAAEAIARVEQTANNAMELASLLDSAVKDALVAIEKRLSDKP